MDDGKFKILKIHSLLLRFSIIQLKEVYFSLHFLSFSNLYSGTSSLADILEFSQTDCLLERFKILCAPFRFLFCQHFTNGRIMKSSVAPKHGDFSWLKVLLITLAYGS